MKIWKPPAPQKQPAHTTPEPHIPIKETPPPKATAPTAGSQNVALLSFCKEQQEHIRRGKSIPSEITIAMNTGEFDPLEMLDKAIYCISLMCGEMVTYDIAKRNIQKYKAQRGIS